MIPITIVNKGNQPTYNRRAPHCRHGIKIPICHYKPVRTARAATVGGYIHVIAKVPFYASFLEEILHLEGVVTMNSNIY